MERFLPQFWQLEGFSLERAAVSAEPDSGFLQGVPIYSVVHMSKLISNMARCGKVGVTQRSAGSSSDDAVAADAKPSSCAECVTLID